MSPLKSAKKLPSSAIAGQPVTAVEAAAPQRKRRSSGRATLDDVARVAQVSPITASRALRGHATVSPDLVLRVQEAARSLRYVPDPAARALASQRSTQVLVLVPMLSNALFVDLLESVHRTLFPAGYQPLIGVTHYDPNEEELLLRTYLPMRPAGLLLTGYDRTAAALALLQDSGVPCVHLMETRQAPGNYSVGFSQADAGAAITQHLIERGRKRIGFCAVQLDERTLQRGQGWRRAMQAAGLYDPALECLVPDRSSLALGGELLQRMLAAHPDLDALFFCNDDIAQGALLAANRMGLDVPGRIAIAGFNDLPGSDQMLPPLTTVRTPLKEVGQAGANMLLALMRDQTLPSPCVELGYELIVREST